MEINEQLVQAITTLIQGVEIGQKSGAYDLKSAGHLNQAVFIASENIKFFGNELELKKKQTQQVPSELPIEEPQNKDQPIRRNNSKK